MPSTPLYRTIREQIVEQLRKEVMSGQLAEGDPLREESLARRFGVSRGPIRDALLQLTQEGLLVSRPNSGAKVGPSPSVVLQPLLVDLRRQIESYALGRVFETQTDEDLVELTVLLENFRAACKAGEMSEVIAHDMAFHRWIVERAGEPDLVAVWLPILLRFRLRYTRHRSLMESYQEHKAVVEALRRKDRAAAVRALEANIQ